MTSFAQIGNDLYTGRRSIDFVGRRRRFYLVSAVLLLIAGMGLGIRHLNLGLEFTGGTEFRVAGVDVSQDYEQTARDTVNETAPGHPANVTRLGTGSSGTIRIQTEALSTTQNDTVRTSLAKAFGVGENNVSVSSVGPSWGASVSAKALQALLIFLALVTLAMAVYFRTWKMAVSALVALLHDLVITVGIYALSGFEVTPASMIGFLTILGYSLYDTVVVFDKVRENTTEAFGNGRSSFARAANLAVNQTLVRSINTTVVALLPIAAILFVGFTILGPGTLLDLALALFVGIAVGAYSSIFIATPLLVTLRAKEPAVIDLAKRAERYRARNPRRPEEPVDSAEPDHDASVDGPGQPAAVGSDAPELAARTPESTVTGRSVHKYAQAAGPRNQPKRSPKSKR
jgi:preprotein translocase subunit SecF